MDSGFIPSTTTSSQGEGRGRSKNGFTTHYLGFFISKMASIDNEIAILQARLVELEKVKNTPPPPKITPQQLLERKLEAAKHNQWRPKESPVATAGRFARQSEIEILESIVESLNQINARLDALEKK
jgi:hypothetical protein